MILVGITGSIGCGKTTLADIIRKLGFVVFDVDGFVREIYRDENFLKVLSITFNNSVINGVADKKYLRNIVFSDKNKLEKLENIIYPLLNKKLKNVISKFACKNDVFFIDAPLLFEKKWDKFCNFVILADVDYEIRKQRVMKRDNISEEDFCKIDSLQISNDRKKDFSDLVINTDKNIGLLKVELIKIIENIRGF